MCSKRHLSLSILSLLMMGCVVPGSDPKEPLPDKPTPQVYLLSIAVSPAVNLSAESFDVFDPQKFSGYTIYDDSTSTVMPIILRVLTEQPGDILTIKRGNETLRPIGAQGFFMIDRLSREESLVRLSVRVSRIIKLDGMPVAISNSYSVSITRSSPTATMFFFVNQCFAGIADKTTVVIGNPSHNITAETQAAAGQISELEDLLEGTVSKRRFRKIDENGGKNEQAWEEYVSYDIDKIMAKLEEIETSVDNLNPTDLYIRIPKQFFHYTGAPGFAQLDPEYTAIYELAGVGASGGHMTEISSKYSSLGGKGGEVKAQFSIQKQITKPQVLCVRIGGQGQGTAEYSSITGNYTIAKTNYAYRKIGGWPNGNSGGDAGGGPHFDNTQIQNAGWAPGTGGGGSTDIIFIDTDDASVMDLVEKIKKNVPGAVSNFEGFIGSTFLYDRYSDSRYIVAAGGGGCAHSPDMPWRIFSGGDADKDGGGFNTTGISVPLTGASPVDWGYQGVDGSISSPMPGSGGGGGGFKGGGANLNKGVAFSGAGGTNFIRGDAQPSVNLIDTASTYGDGYASITWINDQ